MQLLDWFCRKSIHQHVCLELKLYSCWHKTASEETVAVKTHFWATSWRSQVFIWDPWLSSHQKKTPTRLQEDTANFKLICTMNYHPRRRRLFASSLRLRFLRSRSRSLCVGSGCSKVWEIGLLVLLLIELRGELRGIGWKVKSRLFSGDGDTSSPAKKRWLVGFDAKDKNLIKKWNEIRKFGTNQYLWKTGGSEFPISGGSLKSRQVTWWAGRKGMWRTSRTSRSRKSRLCPALFRVGLLHLHLLRLPSPIYWANKTSTPRVFYFFFRFCSFSSHSISEPGKKKLLWFKNQRDRKSAIIFYPLDFSIKLIFDSLSSSSSCLSSIHSQHCTQRPARIKNWCSHRNSKNAHLFRQNPTSRRASCWGRLRNSLCRTLCWGCRWFLRALFRSCSRWGHRRNLRRSNFWRSRHCFSCTAMHRYGARFAFFRLSRLRQTYADMQMWKSLTFPFWKQSKKSKYRLVQAKGTTIHKGSSALCFSS